MSATKNCKTSYEALANNSAFNHSRPNPGSNTLGIGTVEIEFNAETIVKFYNSPGDKAYSTRIEFFDDASVNGWNIKDVKNVQMWLKPQSMWLDYHHFVFRCKSFNKDWLEVVVNNEDGKSYWIRRTEQTIFKTWEEYFKSMFAVDRLPEENQKIRTRPTDAANEVKYEGRGCFQVISLKGDWIEISSIDHCPDEKATQIKNGWIRWRRGEKLLIRCYSTS
jgi:hypothetical protein